MFNDKKIFKVEKHLVQYSAAEKTKIILCLALVRFLTRLYDFYPTLLKSLLSCFSKLMYSGTN